MRKKQICQVKINEMQYPNISLGLNEKGQTVEFKGGLKGQIAQVKITRNRNNKKIGKYLGLIEDSPLEINKNHCPNADICGGCSYQKLDYEVESALKEEMIKDLLVTNKIHIDSDIIFNSPPKIYEYRNKMEYTFGDSYKGGELVLGLHRQNRFYEIVDTINCNIVDSDFNKIREEVQNYFREKGTEFYHKSKKEGLLRHFIIRKAHKTGQIMAILVTTDDQSFDKNEKDKFVEFLLSLKLEGKLVSIYHVTNNSLADAVIAEKIDLFYGEEFITEEMSGLKFRISPFSFFQPNLFTAEIIYEKAIEFADVNKNINVLDLYSGTGTITQLMAKNAKSATGIEIVAEAVEKAKENAKENGIENINFLTGDVLEEIEKVKGEFDLVVLDPPRSGINEKTLEKILQVNPEKFVYISCNPKTQVENLKTFLANSYQIKNYQIIDQFPRSRHVESVVLMTRVAPTK